MALISQKPDSPFTPGTPVPPELFVGRKQQLEEAAGYMERAASGRLENLFLVGERGIGKSSFAAYLRRVAEIEKNMLGVHVFLGAVDTLEEMTQRIFEGLLREVRTESSLFEKVRGLFGKHIEKLDLFGVSVRFAPPKDKLEALVNEFPHAVYNFLDQVKSERRGLFIALDDINGLAREKAFADWYKSFVDYTAVHFDRFPVLVVLVGLPDRWEQMTNLQASLARVFRMVRIERLADEEVSEFFQRAFGSVQVEVEPKALDVLVQFSSGYPILMQEIGDAVYAVDSDGKVDIEDANLGILTAANRVGYRYLEPRVYRTVRSPRYRSILRKLGQHGIRRNFTRREVESWLNEEEKRVFSNFLRRMRELGVIERDLEGGPGAYRFVNEIYPVYIWMEAMRWARKPNARKALEGD